MAAPKQVLQAIREEMQRSYRPAEVNKPQERIESSEPPPLESAAMRSALSALYASYGLVGQMPPEPPTFRGRIGARVVQLIQRMLFWYTPQIVHFQYSALRALEEQTKTLESAAAHLQDLKRARETLESRVRQLERELAEERSRNSGLQQSWDDLQSRAERRLAKLANAQEGLEETAVAQGTALEAEMRAREALAAQIETVAEAHGAGLEAEIRAREALTVQVDTLQSQTLPAVLGLERDVMRLKPQQVAQERRISLLLEEARKRWPEPFNAAQLERLGQEDRHNLDAFYVALEDEFRGSREDIKDRLREYLPKLEEAGIGSQDMPILDVGCGRGEWLELLRERHWQASGVDLNRVLLAMCQERGLAVVEADAIEHLRSLPEASLGAVTAFHLIEHLPLSALIDFLDAVVRVLKPGGMAILETPDPNNAFVSTRYFYLDPTHHHPIPPALGRFMAEARGLRRVEIWELHPWPQAHHVDTRTGGEVASRFNECFYGPQDYAIIGRKV